MNLREATKAVEDFFDSHGQNVRPSLLGKGKGKVYELYCLATTVVFLKGLPGVSVGFVGSSVDFKASPGRIDQGRSYFVVHGMGRVLELHTDIEVRTLSSAMRGGVAGPSSHHEIDLVLVENAQDRQRPAHDQVILGVECKAQANFEKQVARQALGVRRELSVYRNRPLTTRLSFPGQRREVKALPPSEFWLAFVDPKGRAYRHGPEKLGSNSDIGVRRNLREGRGPLGDARTVEPRCARRLREVVLNGAGRQGREGDLAKRNGQFRMGRAMIIGSIVALAWCALCPSIAVAQECGTDRNTLKVLEDAATAGATDCLAAHRMVVGVVDSRVEATHAAAVGRVCYPFGERANLNGGPDVPRSIKVHGTTVASVVTSNSGTNIGVASVVWDFRASDCWYFAQQRCMAEPPACGTARGLLEDEFEFYARLWRDLPIVNSSLGVFVYEADGLQSAEDARVLQLVEQIKKQTPDLWARYAQEDRNEDDRTIHVRSTGRIVDQDGKAGLMLHRLLVHYNRELWDHTLFVTALGPDNRELVENVPGCGDRPKKWDPNEPEGHFCVAAPGVHDVAIPEGGWVKNAKGSSYAAPYVAAILAEMSLKCDIRGPELLTRLLGTADRSPPYDVIETYGAGFITRERALEDCKS